MPVKECNAMWVYAGSPERLRQIKEESKKRGVQASKYLMAAEEYFRTSQEPRPASGQDLNKLQEENRRLALELHESEHRIARLEGDLRKVRHEEILKPEGTGEIDPELLSIIRAGPIHDYRLLAALGVEPGSETSRGIAKQLQILEATGFIARTSQGWKWK
jgi:predicted RNase H-like nuclease (RuvC/YqgF family)